MSTTKIDGSGVTFPDGSVQPSAGSKIIWLATTTALLADTGRSSTLAFTDMDITSYVSAAAKFAILSGYFQSAGTVGAENGLDVRKNGDTPVAPVHLAIIRNQVVSVTTDQAFFAIVALDAGHIFEYNINVAGTSSVDSIINLVGYIE